MGESRPGRAQSPAPFVFQDRTEMVNLAWAWVIRSAHRVLSKGPYLTLRKYEAIIWDFFFFHLNNWPLILAAHLIIWGSFFFFFFKGRKGL